MRSAADREADMRMVGRETDMPLTTANRERTMGYERWFCTIGLKFEKALVRDKNLESAVLGYLLSPLHPLCGNVYKTPNKVSDVNLI